MKFWTREFWTNLLCLTALMATTATVYADTEVGWLLLAPPVYVNHPAVIRGDMPLKYWQQIQAFNTADECEASRAQSYARQDTDFTAHERVMQSLCVPANDWRFKEK